LKSLLQIKLQNKAILNRLTSIESSIQGKQPNRAALSSDFADFPLISVECLKMADGKLANTSKLQDEFVSTLSFSVEMIQYQTVHCTFHLQVGTLNGFGGADVSKCTTRMLQFIMSFMTDEVAI